MSDEFERFEKQYPGFDSAELRKILEAMSEKWSLLSLLASETNRSLSTFSPTPRLGTYPSCLEKKPFFRHIQVDDADHLITVLSNYESTPNLLFRGVSQAQYRLYSSLQRQLLAENELPDIAYKDLWPDLITALKEENDGIVLKFLKYQGIENITDLAALSFLQHYGCRTPLLDWTWDLRKALWFLTRQSSMKEPTTEIDNYASLYSIREHSAVLLGIKNEIDELFSLVPKATNEQIEESLGLPEFFSTLTSRFGEDTPEKIRDELRTRRGARFFRNRLHKILDVDLLSMRLVTFVSDKDDMPELSLRLYNNLNIVNQDGAFFLNSHPFSPLEEILVGMKIQFDDGQKEQLITCLDINKRLFPILMRYLEVSNMTEEIVFPDPFRICQNIAAAKLYHSNEKRESTKCEDVGSSGKWESLIVDAITKKQQYMIELTEEIGKLAQSPQVKKEHMINMVLELEDMKALIKWKDRMEKKS